MLSHDAKVDQVWVLLASFFDLVPPLLPVISSPLWGNKTYYFQSCDQCLANVYKTIVLFLNLLVISSHLCNIILKAKDTNAIFRSATYINLCKLTHVNRCRWWQLWILWSAVLFLYYSFSSSYADWSLELQYFPTYYRLANRVLTDRNWLVC